jgi:hypothetical protein
MPQITRPVLIPAQLHLASGRVTMAQQRRVGAVAVAWAKLENSINDLIWTIQGKDLAAGRADTQSLDITKLLAALQTAVSRQLTDRPLKNERNLIIHGSWGEMDGLPVVGSLRLESGDPSLVTYEHYPPSRMYEIEKYALDATRNVSAIIERLESLREKPSQPPRQG